MIRCNSAQVHSILLIPEKGFLSVTINLNGPRGSKPIRIEIPETDLLGLVAKVNRLTHAPHTIEELPEIDEFANLQRGSAALEPLPDIELPDVEMPR